MKNLFKKNVSIVLVFLIIYLLFCNTVIYADNKFNVGDYFKIGKYNDTPILWRCIGDDDNGKLLLSDKVLCFKVFDVGKGREDFEGVPDVGRCFWEESTLRAWLNSTAPAGKIDWPYGVAPAAYPLQDESYDDEDGFLNNSNFSQQQRNLMMTVSQWTMLPQNKMELSENGLKEPYNITKEIKQGSGTGHDGTETIRILYDISELQEAYYGAAYKIEDTIFLLDEMQLYNMWKTFGTADACAINGTEPETYWFRTACKGGGETIWNKIAYEASGARNNYGIRPAFYLNEETIETMTGSGTEEEPYVLNENADTNNKIDVTLNNNPLAFDQAPIIENDRVLVPLRAIFEALGADVSWSEETQTVTAQKADLNMSLQIDNPQMLVNGESVVLDVAPKIVGDRTLVPIRAVSESLNANVVWQEEARTVAITTE